MSTESPWWKAGVVYQIYPRSYQDSNGDGVGDLPGIAARLDYVAELGVDAIWISPIFPSPMADFGYDVSDYTGIHPEFGTLDDFDALVTAAHSRGLRVLLDLVPNHSSDEHPWFVSARSSRQSPHRDWYIWRDPAPDGGPPNNWRSNFGGSAWVHDEASGQYYLTLFDPKQVDLNWRNPELRQAIYDAMRFWFRRGVDGFRVDVIWMLMKHPDFPDNPPNPSWKPGDPDQWRYLRVYDQGQPEVHNVIREMRTVVDEFPERVLIGEIYMDIEGLMAYYGHQLDEVHLPFNFNLVVMKEWGVAGVRDVVDRYERALPPGAWPNYVLGNHDQSRVASRIGAQRARAAQMLLLTLRGTPTMYYGDEIGMQDVPIPHELMVDPQGIRTPSLSRDPARTPMQWDASPSAGFTTGAPWLPLAASFAEQNVAAQQADPTSMLSLTRRLLALRRASPPLALGDYAAIETGDLEVYAFTRTHAGESYLVALNFGDVGRTLSLTPAGAKGMVVCATGMDRSGAVDLSALDLRPYEGLLMQLV
jgi:alpha-glucosidase